MRVIRKTFSSFVLIALCTMLLGACSLKENTARNRFIHSFTTKYNVYYNGKTAYDKGVLAKIEGHKDDYTERLPVFLVGNESSWSLGQGDFNTAITKSEKAIKLHSITRKPIVNNTKRRTPKQKEFLKKKEYNPFLFNAWFLLGKSYFESGKFSDAASVFSYMMRLYANEPIIRQGAAAWLARSYAQMGWLYDAEDILAQLRRDSLRQPTHGVYNATMADLCLRQDSVEKALPYLQATIHKTRNANQRARLYYLQGQLYFALHQNEQAYQALKRCIRLSPPYELAFNARILQAEVMGDRNSASMLAKLKRMARSANNENYLDQVYYAIGNIHLSQRDTLAAIKAYEEGEVKAKRSEINKGVLLLKLGELYWSTQNFVGAQRCYAQVVGLLNKTHHKYEEAALRSKVLDELVPHTTTICVQDSLLALALLPEHERMKVVEQAIAAYKKQEKEASRSQRDSLLRVENSTADNTFDTEDIDAPQPRPSTTIVNTGEWYFYNSQLVSQGKIEFKKRWGNRPNEDDWRRANKAAVGSVSVESGNNDEQTTIEGEESEPISSTEYITLAPSEDPHSSEYYLSRIPLTEEQKQESHMLIQQALWQVGQIQQDKLNELRLAEASYLRLYENYPTFDEREALCYQLFLLYKRMGNDLQAEHYRNEIINAYSTGKLAYLLSHPDYERIAHEGKAMEDELYTEAYQNFKQENFTAVKQAIVKSKSDFPEGAHRDKFIMLDALLKLQDKKPQEAKSNFQQLLESYPNSDLAPMATAFLQAVKEGRSLGTSTLLDFNTLWQQRSLEEEQNAIEMAQEQQLSSERHVPFLCVIAFMPDSVSHDELLYQLSRFNFTNFVLRNFEINTVFDTGLQQLRISGFKSYDEVRTYATQIVRQKNLSSLLRKVKIILISEENLRKIGVTHSFADYDAFHSKVFTPLRIDIQQSLDANSITETPPYQENIPTTPTRPNEEVAPATLPLTPTTQPVQEEEEEEEEEDVWYDID